MIKSQKSSELLKEIAQDKTLKKNLTYNLLLDKMGNRSFAIAILFFALPSALPLATIPGISFIFGLPITIIAIQVILARKSLWLPKKIGERKISHEKVVKIIHSAMPYLIKVERLLKPRMYFMTSPVMEIINGVAIFILSFLLMMPIPFSNIILATLIIIFCLGSIEKDGVFIVIGYLGFILYLSFMYLFIVAIIKSFFY